MHWMGVLQRSSRKWSQILCCTWQPSINVRKRWCAYYCKYRNEVMALSLALWQLHKAKTRRARPRPRPRPQNSRLRPKNMASRARPRPRPNIPDVVIYRLRLEGAGLGLGLGLGLECHGLGLGLGLGYCRTWYKSGQNKYNNQDKYKKPKDIHKKPQKLNLTKPN